MKTYFSFPATATLALVAVLAACDKGAAEKEGAAAAGAASTASAEAPKPIGNKLKVTTSLGAFTLELLPDAAPKTVENFKKWVGEGFYDGLIFHRVMPNFMIQAGGHYPDMSRKLFKGYVENEADLAKAKGLTNTRGTISMAYSPGNPITGANVQFFINVKNNPDLDFKEKTITGYGHCPFGRVVQGMDVVDKISLVRTKTINEHANVPVEPVTIDKIDDLSPGG